MPGPEMAFTDEPPRDGQSSSDPGPRAGEVNVAADPGLLNPVEFPLGPPIVHSDGTITFDVDER